MQENDILYRIRNLACRYPGSLHTVLEINQFDVFKGELVFFLGVSGVGKSTLIESLGLMNRTIVNRPETSLHYEGGGRSISLFDLWDGPQTALAKFRAEQYSFIFQSSNLFEKISLENNAVMPSFANGSSGKQVKMEARNLAKKLLSNVTDGEYQKKSAGSISGGQKQRLAFIQALVSDHEVLFGDEPTGNLDWGNAKKVMDTLKSHIKSNLKTALVVSHDIHLSVAFADRIVLMTGKSSDTDASRKTGEILQQNIFSREQTGWSSPSGAITDDQMTSILKNHFEQEAS